MALESKEGRNRAKRERVTDWVEAFVLEIETKVGEERHRIEEKDKGYVGPRGSDEEQAVEGRRLASITVTMVVMLKSVGASVGLISHLDPIITYMGNLTSFVDNRSLPEPDGKQFVEHAAELRRGLRLLAEEGE